MLIFVARTKPIPRAPLRDLETAIRLEPKGSPFYPIDQTNRAKLLHREGRENEALPARRERTQGRHQLSPRRIACGSMCCGS